MSLAASSLPSLNLFHSTLFILYLSKQTNSSFLFNKGRKGKQAAMELMESMEWSGCAAERPPAYNPQSIKEEGSLSFIQFHQLTNSSFLSLLNSKKRWIGVELLVFSFRKKKEGRLPKRERREKKKEVGRLRRWAPFHQHSKHPATIHSINSRLISFLVCLACFCWFHSKCCIML